MLKWLTIVAVLGALLFGGPCVAQDHLSHPQATEHSPHGQQKPVTPSSPVVNPLPAAPYSQAKPCYIQENPPEKPLPRPIRPEWVIVYITAIYVGISALMFRAIKKQAGQMEAQTEILLDSVAASQKSAEAADMSAKAAMGVAVPTLMLYGFAFAAKSGESASDFFTHPGVILIAKNFGQSPAFLKGYTITFTCNDLPDEPVYSFPYPCNAEAVVDSQKTFLPDKDTLTLDKPMSDSDVLALASGKKCLTVYGYISYGDIFGSPIRYMKFSKRLMEFDPDPKNMLVMDYGGYKYTGQYENYDPPAKAN